jgi:hypothetical protein
MYAAHFAAGLAIKSYAPKAPTWALLVGAFLPDFFWVAFGLAGIEPSQGTAFFDDWSHSLAMVILWACCKLPPSRSSRSHYKDEVWAESQRAKVFSAGPFVLTTGEEEL